ncbi:MAG: DUF2442 domain-containing protein [Gammaproteobacteria bacterium]|nr:DUF2442 domain-containing protein [Gammaproteobacteria bacterium]
MPTKSNPQENSTARIKPTAPWRVAHIKILKNYSLNVTFNDGISGNVEMYDLIHSQNAGVFASLKDINLFNQAYIEMGVVTWPGEIDLSPDAMHEAIKKEGRWVLK